MSKNKRNSVSMKTTKQNRAVHELRLTSYIGRTDAWGTDLGARVFAKINVDLMKLSDGTLVFIDFAGLERSDVSFQREAVVETVRKHRPKLLFVAVNVEDEDLLTNLDVALDRRGEVLLYCKNDGPARVLGRPLPQEHRKTLERVWQLGEATSALLLADQEAYGGGDERGNAASAKLSTMSSRLVALWKSGLLERVEGTAASGGREHRYFGFP
jgi:hypothetical protein